MSMHIAWDIYHVNGNGNRWWEPKKNRVEDRGSFWKGMNKSIMQKTSKCMRWNSLCMTCFQIQIRMTFFSLFFNLNLPFLHPLIVTCMNFTPQESISRRLHCTKLQSASLLVITLKGIPFWSFGRDGVPMTLLYDTSLGTTLNLLLVSPSS